MPSRNAVFARLNMLLNEDLKKSLLWFFFPQAKGQQGFRAYYSHCTPSQIEELAKQNGLEVEVQAFILDELVFSNFCARVSALAPLAILVIFDNARRCC